MKVEVQIRTIAMNFWASLEHQMHYKKYNNMEMPEVVEELTKCAEIAYNNDVRMQEIRDEISRKSSQNLTVNPVDEESIEHML